MHDGQNLFDETVESAASWRLDVTAQRLIDEGRIEPVIVVGIWNSWVRRLEYFPQKAADYFTPDDQVIMAATKRELGDPLDVPWQGDAYLKFIVGEVKPYVDSHYRTLPGREHTLIAGSSYGGLISLYALTEYPDIFSAAACLSTHWPILYSNAHMSPSEAIRAYLREHLPAAGNHRIYFDYGSEGLDQYYEVHQLQVDKIMESKGYSAGRDWLTRSFPGTDHTERDWAARVDVLLEFLLKLGN
jgi:enterochelin esterase-like enzyme